MAQFPVLSAAEAELVDEGDRSVGEDHDESCPIGKHLLWEVVSSPSC